MTSRTDATAVGSCNVLMVYPRFSPHSFWNYQATCEVVGARYSATPLGLITVAALLPDDWNIRLINRNTEEIDEAEIEWADLVMTGGMLPQQRDTLRVIAIAHEHGKPVVVGGPDVTASPHKYGAAEFRVIGEAEEIMADLVSAWRAGSAGGEFRADGFPDITKSPVPRFDLLKFEHYMHVGVQLSRGCPFTCEFCNVVELNGRSQRIKTTDQMLTELTALYDLGYRGHVDFVDDNLIGNRKMIKRFLPELTGWLERHRFPFEFSTEASINLAEDEELLTLMKRASFFAIFVGIETPDVATLISTSKRQNTKRRIANSIHRIYRAGMFVNAGFIIGFDGETDRVAEAMIECIEESAIPVCMVGLLYALPSTRLWHRLTTEGRLHTGSDTLSSDTNADQCTSGLNFATMRPRREVMQDYRTVVRRIYEPQAYFARVRDLVHRLDLSDQQHRRPFRTLLRDLRSAGRIIWRIGIRDGRSRGPFWRSIGTCLATNPRGIRVVITQAALFLHLSPFARYVDGQISGRIAAADRGGLHECVQLLPSRALK